MSPSFDVKSPTVSMLCRICPFMMTHHSAVPTWKCPLSAAL
jgi:hypothetical protein